MPVPISLLRTLPWRSGDPAKICPAVCDPFKNRANKLLEMVYDIYCDKGIDYLKKCIEHTELKLQTKKEKTTIM